MKPGKILGWGNTEVVKLAFFQLVQKIKIKVNRATCNNIFQLNLLQAINLLMDIAGNPAENIGNIGNTYNAGNPAGNAEII